MPAEEGAQHLLDLVRREVALVLGYEDQRQINSEHAFKDLGLDSLTALELRNRLNSLTGLKLPATLVFDHPTPIALTQYLQQELLHDISASVLASVNKRPVDVQELEDEVHEPIAIVGMACR
ncbi:acyl carrier protein, partial [Kribbella deserti]